MTRRLFYIAFGATIGIMAMRKVSAVAEQMQPDLLAHRLAIGLGEFVGDVRAGMREREHELRSNLGLGLPQAEIDVSRAQLGTG